MVGCIAAIIAALAGGPGGKIFHPMNTPRFVHLRLHSEYSVTDGIVRIDEAVAKAARGSGVKPLIGADCWVQNVTDRDKPARILILVASHKGYLRLCELLSRAWLTNQHRSRPELDKAWLKEGGTEGLIALSGAAGGDIGQALAAGNLEGATKLAKEWSALFPERFYLELQRAGLPQTETLVARTVELATKAKLPVVATHPVQFMKPDDFQAPEARVCSSQGRVNSKTVQCGCSFGHTCGGEFAQVIQRIFAAFSRCTRKPQCGGVNVLRYTEAACVEKGNYGLAVDAS